MEDNWQDGCDGYLHIRCPRALVKRVKDAAHSKAMSHAGWIRMVLLEAVEFYEENANKKDVA